MGEQAVLHLERALLAHMAPSEAIPALRAHLVPSQELLAPIQFIHRRNDGFTNSPQKGMTNELNSNTNQMNGAQGGANSSGGVGTGSGSGGSRSAPSGATHPYRKHDRRPQAGSENQFHSHKNKLPEKGVFIN